MEKLLEQISAYELLNNLIPGVLFCILLSWHTGYQLEINNVIVELVIFYFAGLVVGRFGSLVIEPLYEKVKIINKPDYKDFIAACEKDPKIETLSATNNMYRTFTSVFLLYAIFGIGEQIMTEYAVKRPWFVVIVTVLLILLFSFSYRKQTDYIRNRVNIQVQKEKKEEVGVRK